MSEFAVRSSRDWRKGTFVNKVAYEFVAHFRGTSLDKVSLLLSMLTLSVSMVYALQMQVAGGPRNQQ